MIDFTKCYEKTARLHQYKKKIHNREEYYKMLQHCKKHRSQGKAEKLSHNQEYLQANVYTEFNVENRAKNTLKI